MKLIIGFALLAFTHGRYTTPNCDEVLVHNIHHDKEILVDNKDSPYQLAMDYDTNTLFFSYSNIKSNETFTSAYINLKTNEFGTIPGIRGGFANAVDNQKRIVYLGGSDGLYEFDYETKKASHIDGTNHNIWQMFFKDNVYFSTFPEEEVYVFKNGKAEIVPELTDTVATVLALDNNLDFYYANSSGLFKRTRSNGKTLYLGDYTVNSMTADNNGNLYYSTPNDIYIIDDKGRSNKIASIPNIYGVAIESNGNVIYASQNGLVRLKPTKSPCHVEEKKFNEENDLV